MIVGGSVPVTGLLAGYPVLTGQAIRYAFAGLVLVGWTLARRVRLPMPAWRDVPSLIGTAATGMLGFNACVLAAQHYAQPGLVAAVLGSSPLVLGLVAPLLAGRRPAALPMVGALLAVVGMLVLSGGGGWHGPGLLISVAASAGEASFTLCAVGVVARLGPIGASVHLCFVAAIGGAVLGTALDGTAAWRTPNAPQAMAILFLAVVVTAAGFGCWYFCVSVLGADRAGVLIGLMPVSGLAVSVVLGAQSLTVAAVVGALVVAAGCVIGLRAGRA